MTTAPVRKSAVARRLKPAGAAAIKAGLLAMAIVGLLAGIALNMGLTAD